jgi:hypothetical protein
MATPSLVPSIFDGRLFDSIRDDLKPFDGRLKRSLRVTLTSVIVLVLMLVLQMPFLEYGLYMVFLVSVISQAPPLKTGMGMVLASAGTVALATGVVIFTDNDPLVRLLSVAVITFIAGMLMRGTTLPSLGMAVGFLYCVIIGFWEQGRSETRIVNSSLRLLAAFAFATACAVAVEMVFSPKARTPVDEPPTPVAKPESKPLVIEGAMRDSQNIAFALKLSLCATVCYVLYHAIAWPGISTCVTTVMVATVRTSAATKEKLWQRLAGALLGGVVLGLGSTIFLFPSMDSLTSLCLLVGIVAFLATWIGIGSKFGYVGSQIAFSFYLATLGGPTAPTDLAAPRNRVMGILLASVVMWLVFDQIWPSRKPSREMLPASAAK